MKFTLNVANLGFILDTTLGLLGLAFTEAFTAFTSFTHHNYPFLKPSIRPGMNPEAAATGRPAASTVVECAANCNAVLFNA
jgi:hypothetical protein